jgi:hypothetical protein
MEKNMGQRLQCLAMHFTLAGVRHHVGIRNEIEKIQLFAIKLYEYIDKHIYSAIETYDIATQAATDLKLDGKPVFDDISTTALQAENKPGSFAAFYKLIKRWDLMEIDDLTFVNGLFRECIAFIENRYGIEITLRSGPYFVFEKDA